ncbi:unnamed protein product [Cylicostephanus goldi]|uniref:Uncharacterized protein n=1 Tax=Cylicostephanus goldi TaxID=71465 RepID=A0A3P6S9A5_CYLGO|nr:unnamed protein product [Cylicostephanus goldi]
MLLLVLVSLPLLALSADPVVVQDGDANVKNIAPETTIGPLPAYIYKPGPDHKFKYANYKHFPLPSSTEETPVAVEISVAAPLTIENPVPEPPPPPPVPVILSPYFIPYFSRLPLDNDYLLMSRQQELPPTFADYLSRKAYGNGPRYGDYIGAEKFFAQLQKEKVVKKIDGV